MKSYVTMTREELLAEQESVQLQYDAAKSLKLKLNMARGKPGKEQLDLVSDLMTVLTDSHAQKNVRKHLSEGADNLILCVEQTIALTQIRRGNIYIPGLKNKRFYIGFRL